MPQPTGGLIEITVNQTFLTKPAANVFYYWNASNTEPASFQALAADFQTKVQQEMSLIQSVNLLYDNIRLRTIFGTIPDLTFVPTQANGQRTGDPYNSTSAAGFRLQPQTKETRAGYKRLAGMSEDDIQGNSFQPAFQALLDAFADQLELSLDSGTTVYDPVVYSPNTLNRPTPFVNPVVSAARMQLVRNQLTRYQRS